ncbi:MAG: hypothetical protein JWL80_316 [Parcubacteria group bacterium]|nr:hypothetical protein [Parcubacteria group bacterium]
MPGYLSTIHKRSDAHKKRFAFGVSALFTLALFSVWSVFAFHSTPSAAVAKNTLEPVQIAGAAAALDTAPESPFEAIKGGFQNLSAAISQGFNQTKTTIQSVDVNQEYKSVRDEALPNTTYGN